MYCLVRLLLKVPVVKKPLLVPVKLLNWHRAMMHG